MSDKALAAVGGPAFPLQSIGTDSAPGHSGMTLRMYIAVQAMSGMLSDVPKTFYGPDWKEKLVKSSFEIADAMIAEDLK